MTERHYSVGLGGDPLDGDVQAETAREAKAVDEANAANAASAAEAAKPTEVETAEAKKVVEEEKVAADKAEVDSKAADEARVAGVAAGRVSEAEDLRVAEEEAARLKVASDARIKLDEENRKAREEADRNTEAAIQAEVARSRDGKPVERVPVEIMDDRHAARMLEDPEYAAEMHRRAGTGEGKVIDSRRFETFATKDAKVEADRVAAQNWEQSDEAHRAEAQREADTTRVQEPYETPTVVETEGEPDPFRSLNDQ